MIDKVKRIVTRLETAYGREEWSPRLGLLDELVYTILSQNTTAANCGRAFDLLKARFPEWTDVLQTDQSELEAAIKPAGLWKAKAHSIRSALQELARQTAKPELDWLNELDSDAAVRLLMGIPGVGRKTAACVLMFGMGRPVLAVDTHVRRLSIRLGLIPECTLDKAHDLLAEIVPPGLVYSFHVGLVKHGREVCRALKPYCSMCVLSSECDWFVGKSEAH